MSGGTSTLRDFLREGLIDEAHRAVIPLVLGRGERLWDGLESLTDTYQIVEAIGSGNVTHLRISRRHP